MDNITIFRDRGNKYYRDYLLDTFMDDEKDLEIRKNCTDQAQKIYELTKISPYLTVYGRRCVEMYKDIILDLIRTAPVMEDRALTVYANQDDEIMMVFSCDPMYRAIIFSDGQISKDVRFTGKDSNDYEYGFDNIRCYDAYMEDGKIRKAQIIESPRDMYIDLYG